MVQVLKANKHNEPIINDQKSYGDYSSGVHLFPFRTEKLSPLAQMVLG